MFVKILSNKQFIVIISIFSLLLFSNKIKFIEFDFSKPKLDVDQWDYQTTAVNYAKDGLFPVMGYKYSSPLYGLFEHVEPDDNLLNYVECVYNKAGTTINLIKPPLYSFLLGITYKYLGLDIQNGILLNYFFLLCSILILFVLFYRFFRIWSYYLIICTCILFYYFGKMGLDNLLPNSILGFIHTLILYLTISKSSRISILNSILIGVLFGLGMLTKGNIIFLGIGVFGWFIISKKIREFTLVLISFLIIMFTWSLYINSFISKYGEKYSSWEDDSLNYSSQCFDEYFSNENVTYLNAYKFYINKYYTLSSVKFDNSVFVNRQVKFQDLVLCHNELSIDGNVHQEIEFMESSSYNTIYNKYGSLGKIFHFYMDNPNRIYKNVVAKILLSNGNNSIFFLALSILGFTILFHNTNVRFFKVFLILSVLFSCLFFALKTVYFPVFSSLVFVLSGIIILNNKRSFWDFLYINLLSALLIIIVFFGNSRFIEYLDLLSCFTIVTSISLLIKKVFCNQENSNKDFLSEEYEVFK